MKIQILSVTVTSKTSAAGKSYQNAEVAFKNLDSGKVESKNITQYSAAFKVAGDANPGQFFNVVTEKDDKGYWQWKSMERVLEGTPSAQPAPASATSHTTRSTYETPEERAQKQVYIVRQSSISSALALLSVGAKTPPNPDDVLVVAQKFADWVFAKPSLENIPNDLPEVE